MNLRINITDLGVPRLSALIARINGPGGRRNLHAAMGVEVQVLTRDHLRGIALEKHGTAARRGAQRYLQSIPE